MSYLHQRFQRGAVWRFLKYLGVFKKLSFVTPGIKVLQQIHAAAGVLCFVFVVHRHETLQVSFGGSSRLALCCTGMCKVMMRAE